MIFKTMKPEDVRKAIAGHADILKDAAKANDELFSRLTCISCGGKVMPIVHPKAPFKANQILPNYVALCLTCEKKFDPVSGLEV